MSHPIHSVYTQETFFSALKADLESAKGLVLLQSPFLRLKRIDTVQRALVQCVRRRVQICVFVQRPWEEDAETTVAANLLVSMGMHVTFLPEVHEKLAVFDELILWDGSLNALSHRNTSERMNRWVCREMVAEAIATHKLDRCIACAENRKSGLVSMGGAIASRRKVLGLSQRDLSLKAGLDQSTIARLETGQDVRMTVLSQVLEALGMGLRAVPAFLLPTIDKIADPQTTDRAR